MIRLGRELVSQAPDGEQAITLKTRIVSEVAMFRQPPHTFQSLRPLLRVNRDLVALPPFPSFTNGRKRRAGSRSPFYAAMK